MEIFSPELYGWKLQPGFSMEPIYPVAEDRRELGNVKSVAVAEKALRTFRGLLWRGEGRAASEYAESFFDGLMGPAGRFQWLLPEFVPTPHAAPVLTAAAGGTQGARTIWACVAWRNAYGTTRPSPVAELAVPANELVTVHMKRPPSGAASAVVYASEVGAVLVSEQTVTGLQAWTQPDAALLLLTPLPLAENTAKRLLTVKLVETCRVQRIQGHIYEMTMDFEESY